MKKPVVYQYLDFDYYSATPKYLQLANCIIKAVAEGALKQSDMLPSINELSFEFEISRDTAEKGYKYLKKIGLLGSVPGKGYFVKNATTEQRLKIFLLFNKLSAHKKMMYDAFVQTLGNMAAIDFYIYNNDVLLFKKLLEQRRDGYTHFVIIPHFIDGADNAYQIINTIPKEKLILVDKLVPGVTGCYGAVYENFEEDIYVALTTANEQLSKYHTLKIIFPDNSYYPHEILDGFQRFCQQYAFSHKVVHSIKDEPINEGEVFINLMEDDLVVLLERLLALGFEAGKQIGVISYNETPLKRLILNGITTISTDFALMGRRAAEFVLESATAHEAIPFSLRLRASL